ncbi:MAG: hypothetical protein P9L93_05725 [Candidatus Gorgyraea atricola]|nr:hypothetical protein [Candidatus Gorgyraea atricola]
MKKLVALTISLLVVAMAIPCFAGSARILSDEELDMVSAKGVDQPEVIWEILPMVSGNMEDFFANGVPYDLGSGNTVFTMGGNAQQNLQALSNITAVNSAVGVLINITVVNGNLTGTVNQTNNAQITNFVF